MQALSKPDRYGRSHRGDCRSGDVDDRHGDPASVHTPNALAMVEFDVAGESARALGQVTTDNVAVGDAVEPIYVNKLREPGAGLKPANVDQSWDGYRFAPLAE